MIDQVQLKQTKSNDWRLGHDFKLKLSKYLPINLSQAINILNDLMADDTSIMPAIKVISIQPLFLAFLNNQNTSHMASQVDALCQESIVMLSPDFASRLRLFLDGYADIKNADTYSQPSTLIASDPLVQNEFDPFISSSSSSRSYVDLPTVLADDNDFSELNKPNQSINSQSFTLSKILIVSIASVLFSLSSLIGIFKFTPACNLLEICSKSTQKLSPQNTPRSKNLNKLNVPIKPNLGQQPTTTQQPQPAYVPQPQPAYVPQPNGPVLRDEPLW